MGYVRMVAFALLCIAVGIVFSQTSINKQSAAAAGGSLNSHATMSHSWPVGRAPKITLKVNNTGYSVAELQQKLDAAVQSVRTRAASGKSSVKWVCGTQPTPKLKPNGFSTDYIYTGAIVVLFNNTTTDPETLAAYGEYFDDAFSDSDKIVVTPLDQAGDNYLSFEKWDFAGSTSPFATSTLRSFGLCTMRFDLKPWGNYELTSSMWQQPIKGSSVAIDPYLSNLNSSSDGTWYIVIGAMQGNNVLSPAASQK